MHYPHSKAIANATAGTYEVLGELGRDPAGAPAYLARELSTDQLVALRLAPSAGGEPELVVSRQLDGSLPAAGISCPSCGERIASWARFCTRCRMDLTGAAEAGGRASQEELQRAVRTAAGGRFDILGQMRHAEGGDGVFFGRERQTGQIVALRLERGSGTSGGPAPARLGVTQVIGPLARPTYPAPAASSGSPPGQGPAAPGTPPGGAPLPPPGGAGGPSSPPTPPAAGATALVCPSCGTEYPAGIFFCPRDGTALTGITRERGLVGMVIGGRYRVLEPLGEGGMGKVYLAEHVKMGRRCALKVMKPVLADDIEAVTRFTREAASAAQISHPNIAAIYDFGETDDGMIYLAMEYAEGEPLSRILQRETRIAPERAAEITRQIADALTAAHALGIVHRDLKPANIIVLSRDGRDTVKLVDFGIAKMIAGTQPQVTRVGFVVGTPEYMSPEQVTGDALDGRSDIYSAACICYELLVGEPAFAGASTDVVIKRRLIEPAPQPRARNDAVPVELDRVITTALARAPADRYQTAAEFRDALADALAAMAKPPARRRRLRWAGWRRARPRPAIPAATTTAPQPAVDAAPDRRRLIYGGLGAGLAVVVLALVLLFTGGDDGAPTVPGAPAGPAAAAADPGPAGAPVTAPAAQPADSGPVLAGTGVAPRTEDPARSQSAEPPPAPSPERPAAPPRARTSPQPEPAAEPARRTEPPAPTPPAGPSAGELAELGRDLTGARRRFEQLGEPAQYDAIIRDVKALGERIARFQQWYPRVDTLAALRASQQSFLDRITRLCIQARRYEPTLRCE